MTDFPSPTPADIAVVLEAFEPLREPDADLGHWAGGDEVEPGVMQMPWFDYSDLVGAWERALYEHNLIYDYLGTPEWYERFAAIRENPALLASADLITVCTVLSTIMRGERFCDGHIAGMFKDGVAHAAMERLEELQRG